MVSLKLLFILGLVAVAAVAMPDRGENGANSRLVGGSPTTIQQFPYIVSLVYFYPGPQITIQRCVGSLVSSWHVLTSGFCFTGASLDLMTVRAGSTYSLSGGTTRSITHFVKHDSYKDTPRAGDIAVAFLNSPLGLTESIGVLYIPPQNNFIPDGFEVKIVSWGFESESGPQLESIKTMNQYKLPLHECQAIFADSDSVTIDDPVLCAAAPGRSICLGDSGAPMVIGETLVGLSSYYDGCNDEKPDVYTRIDRYTDWIIEVATAPQRNAEQIDQDGEMFVPVIIAKQ